MHFKDAVKNPNSIMYYIHKENLQIFQEKHPKKDFIFPVSCLPWWLGAQFCWTVGLFVEHLQPLHFEGAGYKYYRITTDRQAGVESTALQCSQEVLEIPFINTASYRKNLKAQINHFPYAYVYITLLVQKILSGQWCAFLQ